MHTAQQTRLRPFLYRYRNLVERFFSKLKHYRAVATRYDKHASNYLALVKLAAARIWLQTYESVIDERSRQAAPHGRVRRDERVRLRRGSPARTAGPWTSRPGGQCPRRNRRAALPRKSSFARLLT